MGDEGVRDGKAIDRKTISLYCGSNNEGTKEFS